MTNMTNVYGILNELKHMRYNLNELVKACDDKEMDDISDELYEMSFHIREIEEEIGGNWRKLEERSMRNEIMMTMVNLWRTGKDFLYISKIYEITPYEVERWITLFDNEYPLPSWACRQSIRGSGLVENIDCVHGIGHPHLNYIKKYDPTGSKSLGAHGCFIGCKCGEE